MLRVVVNDDASSDGTCEIVEAIDDDRVHLYRNDRTLGSARNWNRALSRAQGEFVGLLNHDDLYGPFWLSFAVRILEKNPQVGWVITAYRVVDSDDRVIGAISYFSERREYQCREAFSILARFSGWSPVYLARRKILEDIGMYDEDMGPCADTDLFLRLASRHSLFYSSNPHHAAWRLHTDNLTHSIVPIEYFSRRFRMLRKVFSDTELPDEVLECEEDCYANLCRLVRDEIRALRSRGDSSTAQQLMELLNRW
jgi:glycosyltransferase involved in cell wall biosynthesis